jgi:hypothetical protein
LDSSRKALDGKETRQVRRPAAPACVPGMFDSTEVKVLLPT